MTESHEDRLNRDNSFEEIYRLRLVEMHPSGVYHGVENFNCPTLGQAIEAVEQEIITKGPSNTRLVNHRTLTALKRDHKYIHTGRRRIYLNAWKQKRKDKFIGSIATMKEGGM